MRSSRRKQLARRGRVSESSMRRAVNAEISAAMLHGAELMRSAIMRNRLSRAVWVAAYSAEEARQRHAAAGRYWRHAGCVAALFLYRLIGGWI